MSVTHSAVMTCADISASLTQQRRLTNSSPSAESGDSNELQSFLGTLSLLLILAVHNTQQRRHRSSRQPFRKALLTAVLGEPAFVRRRAGAQPCATVLKLLSVLQWFPSPW